MIKNKKLNIAFLYNVRHSYPNPKNPETFPEADLDDSDTIKWMVEHLKKCGWQVLAIEADENAYSKLNQNRDKIDLAFNYSMGIRGQSGYAQLPAMLEMLTIPYTGCRPLSAAIIQRKDKAKQILISRRIPTLPFQIFRRPEEKLNKDLKFPLIVKPAGRGSSAGITNKSVVYNNSKLKAQINAVLKIFPDDPVLVEPFLTGREFSVSMLGNPPEFLPIIESDHSVLPKKYLPLDSLEVKWHFEEETGGKNFICPAKIGLKLEKKIKNICLNTWQTLEILDFCRIDIRCDKNENPYVLETNSPPGLIPPEVSKTSYFPLAARKKGIDYRQLLKVIVKNALQREKKANC